MNISIQQAASSIKAYEQWHETIAHNLSAASIPGFKASEFFMKSIPKPEGPSQVTPTESGSSSKTYQMPEGYTRLSFSAGPLKKTGIATDLAITGNGFFEIQLPNGERGYTRDGEFKISNDNVLLTKLGHPVLDATGAPITFEPNTGNNFTIGPTGQITENGIFAQKTLKLTEFGEPNELVPMGGGIFKMTDPIAADLKSDGDTTVEVHQYHIEQSNVSTIHEMTRMIQAMRSNEVNHRIIQHHDQRLGKTIAELGQPI